MKNGHKCRVDVLLGGEFLSGIFPHLDDLPRCEIDSVHHVGPPLLIIEAASISPYTTTM